MIAAYSDAIWLEFAGSLVLLPILFFFRRGAVRASAAA